MAEVLDETTPVHRPARLFTVGIPVFNGKSLLRNCLQSVINSTFPRDRYEVVVADDCSTEPETLAILAEFERELADEPGFFRVLTAETNSGGAARPRNRILDEAVGEYVFFVDADDTIGNLALERVADQLVDQSFDWIALNQVPVNGRGTVCVINQPRAEVARIKAMATLTVHKVFRRAEIERQQLRFDEGLPSGQDLSFAFSYLLHASRFLKLGGYDFYYLTQHGGNPNEPGHLSRSAKTPEALIDKNERILRSMLTALKGTDLPAAEQHEIVTRVILPRFLMQERYLKAIVNVGPAAGPYALQRLSELLADPLVTEIDPEQLRGVTGEQLAAIARSEWPALVQLVNPEPEQPALPPARARWLAKGKRVVDHFSGRARHRQLVQELGQLRHSVEGLRDEQRRLEQLLQSERSSPH